MAFSTQKDFFHVPFMNETVEYDCVPNTCVKLKSYNSTFDDRSWAMDNNKQSKFLADIVTCNIPAIMDDEIGPERQPKELTPKAGGDSLLEMASRRLSDFQKLMNINTHLEKKLQESNEQLKTANEENQKIKKILSTKLDNNTGRNFYNTVQQLIGSGKLNKNEENELLHTHKKIENTVKAYEVLQAENNYLKHLIEKLKEELQNLQQQPEQQKQFSQEQQHAKQHSQKYPQQHSQQYLQQYPQQQSQQHPQQQSQQHPQQHSQQHSQQHTQQHPQQHSQQYLQQYHPHQQHRQQGEKESLESIGKITDLDAEYIKEIIKERNILREKCESLKGLENQIDDIQQREHNLNARINEQAKYIDELEAELEKLRKFMNEQNQHTCFNEELLKAQLDDIKEELLQAKCLAQKAEMLQMEVASLRNEILKRDLALNDYDCQYKQLMDVVEELRNNAISNQCGETEATEELAYFTQATLSEILKELNKREIGSGDMKYADGRPFLDDGKAEQCCIELNALQKKIEELETEHLKAVNCQEICADALKRLQELENQNSDLQKQLKNEKMNNARLNEKLKEGSNKMDKISKKINKMEDDINMNAKDTTDLNKDLEGTLQLVKDISEMQIKNQQLTNAVNAINSRDDQKIIDELYKQLQDALDNMKKCEQEKKKLENDLEQQKGEIKKLKNLNNELEISRNKLQNDIKDLQNKIIAKEKAVLEKLQEEKMDQPDGKSGQKDTKPESKSDRQDKRTDQQDAKTTSRGPQGDIQDEITMQGKETDKETGKPTGKETGRPTGKESGRPPGKETARPSGRETARPSGRETARPSGRETARPAKDTRKQLDEMDQDGKGKSKGVKQSQKIIDAGAKKYATEKKEEQAAVEAFVDKNIENVKSSLSRGHGFESQLRKILDDFIQECGFCFCRLMHPKSKLYAICHKFYHCGISTLSFRELAYLHRKIFIQAEKILPGCLLDMILSDHADKAHEILQNMEQFKTEPEAPSIMEICNADEKLKCCCCRNNLCCNNSEEELKEKVFKLERDIENAKEYLDNLKAFPLNSSTCIENDIDSNRQDELATYRTQQTQQYSTRSGDVKVIPVTDRIIRQTDAYWN